VKLIKSLADDLDAKVTLIKRDTATLIQMLAKQCMEKFREAMEAGAENVVIIDVNNKGNDLHNVGESDIIDMLTQTVKMGILYNPLRRMQQMIALFIPTGRLQFVTSKSIFHFCMT
jgi:23S rRNA U2552 (ribose-2'-O)-methylase RlmE/FtsJ